MTAAGMDLMRRHHPIARPEPVRTSAPACARADGSGGRARTSNIRLQRPTFCQLNYPGARRRPVEVRHGAGHRPAVGERGAAVGFCSVRILVVDDDQAVRRSIDRALRLEGYEVATVPSGGEALESLAQSPPDALILDLGLPDVDGLTVCRRMRSAGDDTPVLMLTARDAVDDRVQGLDAGADDYLVKPFALAELLARLRALLRRRFEGEGGLLRVGDLALDLSTREGQRGERTFTLTRIEFDLLEMFLRHPRQVLTREVLLNRVWGFDFDSGTNSLAVYVGYLRRKLEEGGEPRCIQTVRGVGYVLRAA